MGTGNDDDPIDDEGSPPVRRRSSSCPEQKEIINILNKRKEILIQGITFLHKLLVKMLKKSNIFPHSTS